MKLSHAFTLGRFSGAPLIAFLAILLFATPAWARDHFVLDRATLFSPATVSGLDQKITDFHQQTGKEILVVTVSSLDGKTLRQATEDEFAREQVNGVLIFMSKAEHQDAVVGDRAARAFFPPGSFQNIRDAMRGYFRSGDFNTGIQTGVNLALDQYRSHERAIGATSRHGAPFAATTQQSFGGFTLFWFILILIAGFLILRAVMRAFSGPRMMPPGYGGPGYGQGPGYGGGPGYGPGYGGGGGFGGGGGGGFFSGLLGGLGGAWLGNEMFGNHGGVGGNVIDGNQAGMDGGQSLADNTGWQNDAGQSDIGSGSFGDYGDSGGGFDAGGGFDGGGGDSGGGGW